MAPSPTPLDDLRVFSIYEVAERLAVSKRSVERLIAQDELKTLRPSVSVDVSFRSPLTPSVSTSTGVPSNGTEAKRLAQNAHSQLYAISAQP